MSYSKRKRIDVHSDINGKISDYDILKNVPTIDGVPVHGDITESGRYTDETPTAGSKRLITSGAIRAAMERGDLQGPAGLSAYEIALQHGFEGSEEEWLEGLDGKDGYTPEKGVDYLTEEDFAAFAEKSPVQSVNGKTGDVKLTASDVHALPDSTEIPTVPDNISAFNNDADYVTGENLDAELLKKSDTGHTHEEYAKREDLPTVPKNISEFNNDAGYLTEHQSLENYPTKSEVETDFIEARAEIVEALGKKQDALEKYVESVNGQSGRVVLSASDVKALPDTTVIPTVPNNVSAFVNDVGYLTEHQSLEEYEKKTGTNDKITEHNVNDSSHQDIRLLITNLVNRLNAIADSDDTTLDQLSEIVAYIRSNKSLIDAITTEKISYSDIINNLETNVANKPLSASMGVVLKAAIDAIVIPTKVSAFENDKSYVTSTELNSGLSGKQDKLSSYVSSVNGKSGTVNLTASDVEALPVTTEIPTVPTKVSAFENDAGYLTAHQDLSSYATKSDVPTALSQLTGDSTHRVVTDAEKTAWNNKSNFSGSYNDLTDKPTSLPAKGGNADTVDSLHFVVSDTVPTVDNRSVITFVIEE